MKYTPYVPPASGVRKEPKRKPKAVPKKVLAFVNKIRAAMMLPPLTKLPKGEPNQPHSCPIANALSGKNIDDVEVNSTHISAHGHMPATTVIPGVTVSGDVDVELDAPEHVSRFIRAFDDGEYPQLEQ